MADGSDALTAEPRTPLAKRITPSQWEAIDAAVAVVLAGLTIPALVGVDHNIAHRLPLWAEVLVALASTLPLAVRRRRPLSVLAVMGVALTVATAFAVVFGPIPAIGLAVYTVATQRDRRSSLTALLALEVALVTAVVVVEVTTTVKGDLTFTPVIAAAGWFAGDSVRARRAYAAGLAEQAAQRRREEVERAQRSVVEERVRIARDLHDVVAHSLSVIAVQAGMGRHVLDSQPEQAAAALAAVETTSRGALGELRRVVGLLRQAEQPDPTLSPAPGLGDLPQLLEQVRSAGVQVDLDVRGEPRYLPPGMELSLYRIVQEALTNVVKHAGPARARVDISYAADAIGVEVVDDGRGRDSRSADANGALPDRVRSPVTTIADRAGSDVVRHGIIGMRERVALFSGSLTVGPGPTGGFQVSVRLPLEPAGDHP
jgi:signal transduction histidine kinase